MLANQAQVREIPKLSWGLRVEIGVEELGLKNWGWGLRAEGVEIGFAVIAACASALGISLGNWAWESCFGIRLGNHASESGLKIRLGNQAWESGLGIRPRNQA